MCCIVVPLASILRHQFGHCSDPFRQPAEFAADRTGVARLEFANLNTLTGWGSAFPAPSGGA